MAYTREQRRNIKRLIRVANQEGASPMERKALLEAAGVESNYRHLSYGDRDSVGILQQRPSQGWGPAGESLEKDARQFLRAAKQASGEYGTAGALAQGVQRSAFPERYDQRSGEVERLLAQFGSRPPGGTRGYGQPSFTSTPGVDNSALRQQLQQGYLLDRNDPDALLQLALGLRGAQDVAPSTTLTPGKRIRRTGAKGRTLDINELFYDPLGFYLDEGKRYQGAIGGHPEHLHVGTNNPADADRIGRMALKRGLHVSENETFDPVDPVHTKGSLHYSDRADDISGDPVQIRRLVKKLLRRRKRPQ